MNKKTIPVLVKQTFLVAAKKYDIRPCDVSTSQFWSVAKDIKEWEVRKLGGLTGLRDSMFPSNKASSTQPRSKKFKPVIKKLESFVVHSAEIKQLFKDAKLGKDEILRVVVQPDTHFPEYDSDAISTFCNFLKYYKPHGLINLGDFMEMGSVSHWGTNGNKFKDEAIGARELLKRIGDAAGPQCIFKRFLIGNHESWMTQYFELKTPELGDLNEIDTGVSLKFEDILGLKDFGYRTVPLNEILNVGDANFIHGYYTSRNHAQTHLNVFGVNIYYGHLHDIQSYSGVSVKGTHEAMSLGCLRTLNAPFMKGKPNNWNHSFGIFEFRSDGTYTRYAPILINGVFSFNGKIFKP